ncbi:MAG: hypothetical protein IBX72_05305 [Nitrospirae bacterium]|nr:hypothetical protein [Nitrospirota bacterium]
MNITNRYHKVFFLVNVWVSIVLLTGTAYSQEMIQKQEMEFAQHSLTEYVKNIINERNFANFGFKSLEEAKIARLGDPYPVMIIGLNNLKGYKSGTGAKALLIDARTLWFPVMVKGETRTKMEIVEKDGKWIAGEFGGVKVVRKITMAKNQLPMLLESKEITALYKTMLVKIPSLYAEFLYVENSKREFLIPAMIQPQRYKLQNGQIYTADEVLSKLKEFAKEIDEKKVM